MRRCRRCESYKERYKVDRCHVKGRKKKRISSMLQTEKKVEPMPSLPLNIFLCPTHFLSSTHQHGAPSLRYSGVPHFPNWGITYENAPQTLTIHLFQAASWRSVTSIHLPLTYMIDLWLSLPQKNVRVGSSHLVMFLCGGRGGGNKHGCKA